MAQIKEEHISHWAKDERRDAVIFLTANTVDGTLNNVSCKPVIDCILTSIVQDVMKLEAEAVLPVVVHAGGGDSRLLFQSPVVHRDCLWLVVDSNNVRSRPIFQGRCQS